MTIPAEKLDAWRQEAKNAGGKGWAWTCRVLCDELEKLKAQVSSLEGENIQQERNQYGSKILAERTHYCRIIYELRIEVSRLEDEVLVRKTGFIYHRPGEWQPPLDSTIHAGMRFGLGAAAKLARSMDDS